MDKNLSPQDPISVEIRSGDIDIQLEQVPAVESGTRGIRLSNWRDGMSVSGSVELNEKELVTLLANAIRAGVISPNFIRSLRAEFEI